MSEEAVSEAPIETGEVIPEVNANIPIVPGESDAPTTDTPVETGLLGGGVETPAAEPNSEPTPEPSIYGDRQIAWPENFSDEFKNETALKPYVGEDGKFNVNGAIKSLIHAQKSLGQGRVRIPGPDAPTEDLVSFNEQVYGYTQDIADYPVEYDPETSAVNPEFADAFIVHAHNEMYPPGMAQETLNFLNKAVSDTNEANEKEYNQQVEKDIGDLRTKWGTAFEKKIGNAKMLISRFGEENGFKEYIEGTGLKDDPKLAEFLATVADKIYGEDSFHDGKDASGFNGQLTPAEAETEINNIYEDATHPYHLKNHRNHQAANEEMLALNAMKRGQRANYKRA